MGLRDRLLDVYDRLLKQHGHQHWWPEDTEFEMMAGAVLTQASAWANVRKALSNLAEAGALTPHGIRSLPQEELAQLVYPSGYFNQKARKLKALAEYLGTRFHDDLEAMAQEDADALRVELLRVHGIGEETADDILLYALGKAAFVVDNYTKRILSRLGLAPEKGSYTAYRTLFMANLPPERGLFAEYHALIVRHGKEVCRKLPACEVCSLLELCPTGKSMTAARQRTRRP